MEWGGGVGSGSERVTESCGKGCARTGGVQHSEVKM